MTHRSSESLRSGLHPGAKSNYLQIRYSCPTYLLTIGRRPVRSRQNSREISDMPRTTFGHVDGDGPLASLVEAVSAVPVARLLLFSLGQEMSDPVLTERTRELRDGRGLGFPVLGGTDLWFAELNRDRPDTSAMDGLVYSITPQVHVFDEESIAQSLEAQPDTVRTAIGFAVSIRFRVASAATEVPCVRAIAVSESPAWTT